MSREEEDDGFLSRWSKRKRSETPVEPSVKQPEEVKAETEDAPVLSDEELLAKYNLPDPETLMPGDDYGAFLRAPLPVHLQRTALRKLWRSNPVLAVLDGLNDYDTDFTGDSVPMGQLKTAYKVGRGFLTDVVEAEDAPPEHEDPVPEVVAQAEVEDPAPSLAEAETPGEPVEEADPGHSFAPDDETDAPAPQTRRRMAFRFTDAD